MNLTAYHAKLYAHELTKRSSSDNVDKLASALSDAQVDLNPHQIEAALFAFRSPLSKGAILADEVEVASGLRFNLCLPGPVATNMRAQSHPGELGSSLPSAESLAGDFLYLIGRDSAGISGGLLECAYHKA